MTKCFVALYLDCVSISRKRSLLENHIPFVVNNCQIYLPFLGICLQEKLKAKKEDVVKFTPSAQLLFLYYFYQNKKELLTSDFGKRFNLSEMTTTRALRQLEGTGLFDVKKGPIKNSNILSSKINSKEELFFKIEAFLINPVKENIYIDKDEVKPKTNLVLSGDSYLTLFTMIEQNRIKTWATCGKKGRFSTATNELLDPSKQEKVEIWKYDPTSMNTKMCDPISVYLSYTNFDDERINMERKKLIVKAIGESNSDTWT
ncbi:MAG: hypothetical protein HUK24_05865 [Sphaerochaetaceae bacterium]|nr:hypothetical protein [Sphaerochaetaceae bacterium]